MKTLKEIATLVLERRQRMNPTVMQGEMTNVLGEEGLREALARRWLTPNYESGYLQVANYGSPVEEMQQIAALPDAATEPAKLTEGRDLCQTHALRGRASLQEATYLSEIAAPATGRPSPGFVNAPSPTSAPAAAPPVMPAAPTAAPAPPRAGAPGGQGMNVGEDVAVVQDGKTFQGKVQSGQNGRYKISFGGPERPADRDYSEQEISRIQPAR